MKICPGTVSLVRFPQSDLLQGKYRPVVVLSGLPGPFGDWLVCAVTSQLQHNIEGWDETIFPHDLDFKASGLKAPSLIRIGKLATVESRILEGILGMIDDKRLNNIQIKLSDHLHKQTG